MKNQLTDEIISLIDWNEFFRFWKISGIIPDILKNEEAKKLFDDANNLLKTRQDCGEAKIEEFSARSENDNIIIDEKYVVRCFRQQTKKPDGEPYFCLADFIDGKIGIFAITTGDNSEETDDLYNSLLYNSLSQRLVEAFSQYYQRKHNALAFAIGYPSLPDLRIMKIADEILDFKSIGITLNENYMMSPLASVCGFYVTHPRARYFAVGKISQEQYEDYARRGNESAEEVKKWVKE
jgi:cobalamin-dependent methionine synthase I